MFMLHPEIKPYAKHQIPVDAPHELYCEESGNPKGIPVLFVHGGPGAGCNASHRRFFDCDKYRIILFDQRGSGQSTPHADLTNNTTQHLINDIEVIRKQLGIEQWLLFGGSWGSTLSLAYAQQFPVRVLGMILRGIFLCRQKDIDWFYQYGASLIFPDYWEDFISIIPVEERHNLMAAYHKRLTGNDEIARMAAAKAWSLWEARTATLQPNQGVIEHFIQPHAALSLARIENHFFINKTFMEEGRLLKNADKLADIPGIIVHGRYDMVCPLDNALSLHRVWPNSQLRIVCSSGHSATEPAIVDALVRATKEMAEKLAPLFL